MNILGQTETDIGTVTFVMNAGKFEIRTHKMAFTVPEAFNLLPKASRYPYIDFLLFFLRHRKHLGSN